MVDVASDSEREFVKQMAAQNAQAVADVSEANSAQAVADVAFSKPVDDHETVRRVTALPYDPADLDRAVANQLAAHADPIKAELALAYDRVTTVIQWAHDLWDMFHEHFGGKLPMPVPPPKPGAGVE